jgi:hypothetical protein
VVLPYASYLRVYEPVDELTPPRPGAAGGEPRLEVVTTVTLAREQETILARATASSAPPGGDDDLAGCYLMRHEGRLFLCPVDLLLRCWLALAAFTEDTDATTRGLFFDPTRLDVAREEFEAWHLSNPRAVPHIREATWGVPRTWFLLVTQEERTVYDLQGTASVRFRSPMADARTRLASAEGLLSEMVDDAELIDELADLGGWLSAFSAESWVEVDYAGVAGLLPGRVDEDESAHQIGSALAAVERRDFAAAGDAYRNFVERWRVVNALERAN